VSVVGIRLARFNTYTGTEAKANFFGLPCPCASGMLMTYIVLMDFLMKMNVITQDAHFLLPGVIVLVVVGSILMLTNIEYDTTHQFFFGRLHGRSRILLVVVLVSFLIKWPAATFFAICYTYVGYGFSRYMYRQLIASKAEQL